MQVLHFAVCPTELSTKCKRLGHCEIPLEKYNPDKENVLSWNFPIARVGIPLWMAYPDRFKYYIRNQLGCLVGKGFLKCMNRQGME